VPVDASTGTPAPALIEELRLTRFKSFRDGRLPLDDLTLLIGRNGSGKSNAIEALEVLARLAAGDDIRDALDGTRRADAPIRGGAAGCAPYGERSFALGCTVRAGARTLDFDVTIQTEPHVQILSERLDAAGPRGPRSLLCSEDAEPGMADIRARYANGRKGPNPAATFRADRLLISQAAARLPGSSKAVREVLDGAATIVDALRAVAVLDPVPHLMRDYVPERDNEVLARHAENVSAVVARLRGDKEVWERFRELVTSLPEQKLSTIIVERSKLGDVVIALKEQRGRRTYVVPVRQMSDGMLRFIAFAAALLEAPLTEEAASRAQETLVVEEIENGLHPTQARRLVDLIKDEATRRDVRALATTHSPALLSALAAADHRYVVVCDRDPGTGGSRLRRLVDLPDYPRAMAQGTLGEAVTEDRLTRGPSREAAREFEDLLERL
jgi:ABC-type cobalamin/Fe3+-siderophores transport system ATPase subunit